MSPAAGYKSKFPFPGEITICLKRVRSDGWFFYKGGHMFESCRRAYYL